jgi:signal peptidase II
VAGPPRLPHLLPAVSLASLVLAADLATKQVFWNGGTVIDVAPPFFSIVPRENTGGVFGLLAGTSLANRLFIAVSIAAVGFLGWLFAASSAKLGLPFALAVGAILGGAAGNLFDRLHYGFVRDFLEFSAGRFTWPTFNVADSAICIGTGFLAWKLWRAPPEKTS